VLVVSTAVPVGSNGVSIRRRHFGPILDRDAGREPREDEDLAVSAL